MRRIAILTVIVAMLLCPFVSVIDSVDSDAEDLNTLYVSEDVTAWIYDGTKYIEYKGPQKVNISNNAIKMWALKDNNDDIQILLNNESYSEGEHITVEKNKNYCFKLETIRILSFVLKNDLEDESVFTDWKKYDTTFVKEVDNSFLENYVLPTNVACIEPHKAIASWSDLNGNACESINFSIIDKDVEIKPVIGERLYQVYFYKELGEYPDIRWLSHINYNMPSMEDGNFLGWFYKDDNNNECEFKEGVELQDNMSVYAKYYEAPQQSAQTSEPDESGSKDVNFYTLLTENGISITDNPVVESIVASTIFVTLALVTFILVFRRH